MTADLLIPFFGKRKASFKRVGAKSKESSDKAFAIGRCSTREARKLLDMSLAEKFTALPLGLIHMLDGDVLSVAAVDERDHELRGALQFATGKEVRLISVEKETLQRAIFYAYKGDDEELKNTFQDVHESAGNRITDLSGLKLRDGDSDAARCLSNIIDYACSHGASDLHLIPLEDGACIRIRINGELLSTESSVCSRSLLSQMISRLKVLSSLDINNRNTPQDGSFAFPVSSQTVHARISTMPTVHGEKAVIRLLGLQGLLKLEELGLEDVARDWLMEALSLREGLVLFCGPTGSGKTTSIYGALECLKRRNMSIISIEDPVELLIPGVTQTSIKEDLGLSFSVALRSSLRQDPDIIMIGEIRDPESMKVAVHAALSGHLILSTIHGRSPFDVILRLKHFGVGEVDIFQSVSMIVNQRLVQSLCPGCRVFDLLETRSRGFEVYKEVGCQACDYSGYSGRIPALEILRIDKSLKESVMAGNPLAASLSPQNFLPLAASLRSFLESGKISVRQFEDLMRYNSVC